MTKAGHCFLVTLILQLFFGAQLDEGLKLHSLFFFHFEPVDPLLLLPLQSSKIFFSVFPTEMVFIHFISFFCFFDHPQITHNPQWGFLGSYPTSIPMDFSLKES
jgi:hypothetical protein